ncbi:T9SS type B sorting domain-containing protein [Lutibacter sp.]
MKKLITIISFLCVLQSFAQGEANFWYFGENAGLDFNSGSPIALNDGQLNTFEGCSSFSDSNGSLLFYSDGTTVWNRNHTVMPNGLGLKGHPSSTQSAMIIPRPGSTTEYYLFTVGSAVSGGEFGFNYYTIDMTADGGLGDIVAGPVNLSGLKSNSWTEKVAAIKGGDCNTFWVLSYAENQFYAYKVSSTGVNSSAVTSTTSHIADDRRGYLKIAPNGKKIAIAHMADMKLLLYDFDNTTGKVTNEISLPLIFPENKPYGVEFSANSEKLYVNASNDYYSNIFSEWNNPSNHFSTLYQFNLSTNITADIIASREIIDSRNLYRGALQLGPDQKIYRAISASYNAGIPFLGVIENPENDGLACNYKHAAIDLGGKNATQGLPPFIASIFSQIEITSVDNQGTTTVLNDQTTNVCVGDSFDIVPEPLTGTSTYNWYFNGDSTPFSNSKNLTFANIDTSASGLYSLEVSQTDSCGNIIILEGEFSIEVYNVPVAYQPSPISECDDDNDGFYSFDLATLRDTEVLNGQSSTEFKISYFRNLADADTNSNEITNPYTNASAFSTDTIIAKIYNILNPACYDTKSFTIQVFETPKPSLTIPVLGQCDSNLIGTDVDGLEIFDLTLKEPEILNGQSSSNFTITYFRNASLTNPILNPTAFQNAIRKQPIYVKIVNTLNPNCSAVTNFDIEVFELPTVTPSASLKQCDNDTDGFSTFNLTEVNDKISVNAANEYFTYFKTFLAADTNDNTQVIANPTTYINQNVTTETVWTRIENSNGCHRVSEINLTVSTTGIPATFKQREYYECDDFIDVINNERDGITAFDFSGITNDVKALFPTNQQLIISYYRDEADALSELNPIVDPSNYRNVGYSSPQIIYIRIDSELDNDCLGIWPRITLNVEPVPVANSITIDRQCDDDFDGFFPFDTSSVQTTVLNGQTGMTVSYFDQDGNSLPSPLPNPFLTKSQTITIRVTDINSIDPDGACFDETTLEFIVDKKPVAYTVPDLVECDDDIDGIFSFDTSNIQTTILNGQTGMLVSYFDQNGNSLPSPLPNPFITDTKTIIIKVENELNSSCTAETTLNFIVNEKPQFELYPTAIYCLNLPPITVETFNALNNYTYEWKNESGAIISTNFDAIISKAGEYTVIATSAEGCQSFPQTITIEASIIATITLDDITIIDDSENNSITISTTNLGIGDYEFAIQKMNEFMGSFQDEPYFENLMPGIYTVFVRDKNSCGIAQIDVSVIGFPKFFTPNNDGYNDTWLVLGVNENFYANSNIYIFDRFGKLITQIDPKSNGWDGIFNGRQLPATDYWFSVELIDNNGNIRSRKGHFSLIRR